MWKLFRDQAWSQGPVPRGWTEAWKLWAPFQPLTLSHQATQHFCYLSPDAHQVVYLGFPFCRKPYKSYSGLFLTTLPFYSPHHPYTVSSSLLVLHENSCLLYLFPEAIPLGWSWGEGPEGLTQPLAWSSSLRGTTVNSCIWKDEGWDC